MRVQMAAVFATAVLDEGGVFRRTESVCVCMCVKEKVVKERREERRTERRAQEQGESKIQEKNRCLTVPRCTATASKWVLDRQSKRPVRVQVPSLHSRWDALNNVSLGVACALVEVRIT